MKSFTFPYPIPLDLAIFFARLDDFIPCVSIAEDDSDSSNNTTNTS